jgi:hypothetical protein
MQRFAWLLIALGLALPGPAFSQSGGAQSVAAYPHGFLFGAWVGGIFPAPTTLNARECQANPTVIFTKDVVLRANTFDAAYAQSLVETVRDTGTGVEFRLVRVGAAPPAAAGPFGLGPILGGDGIGFGCGNPDVLRVQRRGENEILFPNCTQFPYPLVRCPGH